MPGLAAYRRSRYSRPRRGAVAVSLIAASTLASALFLLLPSKAAAWEYFTTDNNEFRVNESHLSKSVGTIQKKTGGSYGHWIRFGPVSRPPVMPIAGDPEAVTGIVEKWGWLLVSDRYNIYKASFVSNSGGWDIARRVWNLGDTGKIIDSMEKDAGGTLLVHWMDAEDEDVTGTIAMALSDVKWPACTGPATDFYTNNNLVSGTSFYYRPPGLDPDLDTGIELIPGTLPIIISAPHGGFQEPGEIPVFNGGLVSDGGSLAASNLLADTLESITGERPHFIINNIRRNRLNLNRKAENDNQDPDAQVLWAGYHLFADEASNWISSACGKGLFIDMHTNGVSHEKNMLAVGFGRAGIEDLRAGTYDRDEFVDRSTIRNLINETLMPIDNVIIGWKLGFGDLANRTSVHTIPDSVLDPMPSGTFFNGGYNVRTHGSDDGGAIDAIQIENHWKYINNGAQNREDYVTDDLAPAVVRWMEHYYGFKLR